jgi:hypothetical protein
MSDPNSLVLCFRRINVLDLFDDAFNFDDMKRFISFSKASKWYISKNQLPSMIFEAE